MNHLVKLKVKKDGKIDWDFVDFPGDTCNNAYKRIKKMMEAKGLSLVTESVLPKEEEVFEEESEYETL